jgi:hypothetical protein
MLVYRFKITSEEHEEFLREVLIQPNQRFLDFHTCLMESSDLFFCEHASFFLTDKKYRKNTEISLHPVAREVKRYNQELDEVVVTTVTTRLMKDSKLKDYIEDPHQRLIYEYSGNANHTFLIELVKIADADGETYFPRCTKWMGELPKKPEIIPEPPQPEESKPKEPQPKIPLPDLSALSRLDGIEEDEEEIAKIDSNLSDFIFAGKPDETRDPAPANSVTEPDDESLEQDNGDSREVDDLDEGMEHLEDYKDIDRIGMTYSGYGEGSDDD